MYVSTEKVAAKLSIEGKGSDAEITAFEKDFATSLREELQKFAEWYKAFYL